MERSTGQLIGDILGRFLEADSGRGGTCLGSFLRIKVILDVTQPLKRCLRFTFPEGTINDNNGLIKDVHPKRRKLCNEAIQGDLIHERFLGADPLALNPRALVEKEKNIIDSGGVFSPLVIGIKSCHDSNNMGPSPSSLPKTGLQMKQFSGPTKSVNPKRNGQRGLSWKAKARATQPASQAQEKHESPRQEGQSISELDFEQETGLAGLPRQSQ
ncbi:hypothetical protein ACE6H2_001363 [Prunus campanulata]